MNLDRRSFFQALWPEFPERAHALIWTAPDRTSHWCRSIEDVERAVAGNLTRDVYFMPGLADQNYGPFERGTARSIVAIPGLWCDLDMKHETRKKSALPSTMAEVMKIVPEDVQPTALVSTGAGVHAYWLFHEPYLIDGDAERDQVSRLLKGWQTLLRRRAQVHGWTLDFTHDLNRILRVPGTFNRKDAENPRAVKVLSLDGPRYDADDIREILQFSEFADRSFGLMQQPAGDIGDGWRSLSFQVMATATVDPDLIEQLCQIDPRFRATWNHDRPDITGPDGAFSEYDLAIANFGIAAGIPQQIIVDLMIEHRRRHGGKPKLRYDYYQRTIWRAMHQSRGGEQVFMEDAREGGTTTAGGHNPSAPPPSPPPASAERPRAGERIEAEGAPTGSADGAPRGSGAPEGEKQQDGQDTGQRQGSQRQAPPRGGADNPFFDPQTDFRATDDAMRIRLIEQVSQWIGMRILRIVKVTGREPSYVIETEQYKIDIESAAKFVDQTYMRARIAAVTNMLIRKHRPDEWDRLVRMALGAVTEKDGGDELEIEGEITAILQQYLPSRGFVDPEHAMPGQSRAPMLVCGHIAVSTMDLHLYLLREFGKRMTPREIAASLAAIGAVSIRVRASGVDQTRWSLPDHDWPPSRYGQKEENDV